MSPKYQFILILIAICGFFIIMQIRSNALEKQFYQIKVHSKVKRRSDWKGSSIDYYLENDIRLTFLKRTGEAEKLRIGDSIVKRKNTLVYNVYRDSLKKYRLIATYNY